MKSRLNFTHNLYTVIALNAAFIHLHLQIIWMLFWCSSFHKEIEICIDFAVKVVQTTVGEIKVE